MAGKIRLGSAVLLAVAALTVPTEAEASGDVPSTRIVGGAATTIEQYPYSAGIFFDGKYGCAGSVIGPRHILTAAHCVIGPASRYTVATGKTNLADPAVGQVIPVIQTFVSPDYRKGRGKQFGHDLAVFALASETTAPPVTVATEAEGAAVSAPGNIYSTAGWGVTNPFKRTSSESQLKATFMGAVGNKKCKGYRKLFKPASMICTFGTRIRPGAKSSFRNSPCNGDSGGGLIASTAAGARLVGTVSYGPRLCGFPLAPAVFARAYDTAARGFIAQAVFTPLPPPL